MDLLLSLTYAAAAEHATRNILPTGLGLMVQDVTKDPPEDEPELLDFDQLDQNTVRSHTVPQTFQYPNSLPRKKKQLFISSIHCPL